MMFVISDTVLLKVYLRLANHSSHVLHGVTTVSLVFHRSVDVFSPSTASSRPTMSSISASTVQSKKAGFKLCTPTKRVSTKERLPATMVQPLVPSLHSQISSSQLQRLSASRLLVQTATSSAEVTLLTRTNHMLVLVRTT